MNVVRLLRATLSMPAVYVPFQRLVWGHAERELVGRYIRPQAGKRLLDIGCGPADILRLMPSVTYVGFDSSERYIRAARRRFGPRGEFRLAAVDSANHFAESAYDVVLAKGVLHHIDDADAARMFRLAKRALRPGGVLITTDGCHHAAQSRLRHVVTGLDRGGFIRSPKEYRDLADRVFGETTWEVRDDLLRIPYSVVIGVSR